MSGYTRFKNLFSTTRYLKIFGNVILASGLLGIVSEFYNRYSHPPDFGVTFAYCAITLTGVIAVMTAGRLTDLEQQLDEMQSRLDNNR